MSMDHVDLEVLKRSGSDTEKKHAARITPVKWKMLTLCGEAHI